MQGFEGRGGGQFHKWDVAVVTPYFNNELSHLLAYYTRCSQSMNVIRIKVHLLYASYFT